MNKGKGEISQREKKGTREKGKENVGEISTREKKWTREKGK